MWGYREAWKLAQQPILPSVLFQHERPTQSDCVFTSHALSNSVLANLTQSLLLQLPPPPLLPLSPCNIPPLPSSVSALGHVSDPVWEATWGPVFGGSLHFLVPVCAVCHCAFPLQDPTGLQPGEIHETQALNVPLLPSESPQTLTYIFVFLSRLPSYIFFPFIYSSTSYPPL